MIDSRLFEHPQLKAALKELTEFSFFEKEIMYYYEEFEKKKLIPDLIGKTVKVTQNQIPSLYKLEQVLCEKMECDIPSIYVYEDFYYGVESKGIHPSWIEISAKTVTDLTEQELLFLLGRELCNIHSNYVYYHILLDEAIKAVHHQIVDSQLVKDSWKMMMYRWSRLAHYSADCFGYAICGDIGAAVTAINKLVLNSSYLAEQMHLPVRCDPNSRQYKFGFTFWD